MSATTRSGVVALLPVHAAAAVFGLAYGLSAPLISLALHERGITESVIGANAAMYALGVLAMAPRLPGLITRWGSWPLLVLGLLVVALTLPLFWLLPWIGAWFVLRFLLGVGSETVLVLTETWVSSSSEEARRSTNIAVYTASLSAGFAIGPAILSVLGTHSWVTYAVGGVLPLVALGVLAAGRARPRAVAESGDSRGLLALAAAAPLAMAGTALNAALEAAGLSMLPIYAVQQGWSPSSASLLISTLMVGAIVLQLPIGWLGDRFPRRPLILLLSVLSAAGACLWPAVMDNAPLAYGLLFVWGGAFVGIYTLIVTEVGTQFHGSELVAVYGAMSVAWGAGALLGPLGAGLALEISAHGLPWFAAVCCALFAVGLMMSRRAPEPDI
jgi:MFS family permease